MIVIDLCGETGASNLVKVISTAKQKKEEKTEAPIRKQVPQPTLQIIPIKRS